MESLYAESDKKTALSTKPLVLSDLGIRFVALVIDLLLFCIILAIIDYYTISSDETALLLKPERLLHVLLGWLYFAGTETCPCQATLGKYVAGLKVQDSAGGRLSFINASIRYFAKPLTLFVLLFRFITRSGLPQYQLLHDKLADAQVVPRS
ncbi:RDD family protein [Pontibacter sp. 172403-2]|uniref:RDD family protein n=1 Tax=Pontibacter rufus TaxID=2791028 RepID=UPI0018AFBEA6|nr:RDD family protein [Pontibacter sp. 172403-2]MBF9253941.1 RDD family protein [Pontibacter sp. 172403-2]